jgi:hypothetical protein
VHRGHACKPSRQQAENPALQPAASELSVLQPAGSELPEVVKESAEEPKAENFAIDEDVKAAFDSIFGKDEQEIGGDEGDAPDCWSCPKVEEPSSELLQAIVDKLAYLLEIDEAGWRAAAKWLDSRALEDGIDLWADWENPTAWATSAVDALRHYIDLKKFPKGIASLESFDTTEELFWGIFPQIGGGPAYKTRSGALFCAASCSRSQRGREESAARSGRASSRF